MAAARRRRPTARGGWLGRDPTAIDLASKKPAWKKVNEIYKKYSRGQDMGELAMREITGMLWMADTINRAKSVEPAALPRPPTRRTWRPTQMIIDYKGIKFDKNGQNELATGVVTQIGWDDEKHTHLAVGPGGARPASRRSSRPRAGRSARQPQQASSAPP